MLGLEKDMMVFGLNFDSVSLLFGLSLATSGFGLDSDGHDFSPRNYCIKVV